MRLFKPVPFLSIALAVTFFTGCSKDSSTDSSSSSYVAPSLSSTDATLTLPTALTSQTSNAAATIASNYAAMVNLLPNALTYLSSIPSGAEESDLKSSNKRYKWTEKSTNYTCWLETTSDNTKKYWKFYRNKTGVDIAGRKILIDAFELITKTGGSITYIVDSDSLIYTYTKTTTGTSSTLLYKTTSKAYYFVLTMNTDLSGSFLAYVGEEALNATLFIEVIWSATGHGSYNIKNVSPSTGTF